MKRIIVILSGIFSLVCYQVSAQNYKTRFTVAKDGSGDFSSIQSAVDACKSFPDDRITIYVKNGVYKEKITIPSWNTKISLVGENKDSTVITYGDYFGKIGRGPNSTFHTATVTVLANDFEAKNLTIENSAGPVGQAIALAVIANRCFFENCRLLGNQDTLYAAGEGAAQYYRNCYIEGTTDFIFGEATAVFDSCTLMSKAGSYITAASTPQHVRYGFVFRNCSLEAAPGVNKVFLGRPWRRYAKVVFINCRMGAFIRAEGWDNWRSPSNENTVFYAEYNSTGAGANPSKRVGWSRQLSAKEAKKYTVENVFTRQPATWNPTTF